MNRKLTGILMIVLFAFCAGCNKSDSDALTNVPAKPRKRGPSKEELEAKTFADNEAKKAKPTPPKQFDLAEFQELFPDFPRFKTYSYDPVLLRFKFRKKHTVTANFHSEQTVTTKNQGKSDVEKTTKDEEIRYTVKSVTPEGDAVIEFTITRAIITTSTDGQQQTFDSDDPNTILHWSERYNSLIINAPIIFNVSTEGKISDVNLDAVFANMDKANPPIKGQAAEAMRQQVKQNMDTLLNGILGRLPEKPVKEGDVIKTDERSMPMPGIGVIHDLNRYRILGVSGDNKKALLQPVNYFYFKTAPQAKIRFSFNSSETNGWILFDIKSGLKTGASAINTSNMTITEPGKPPVEMDAYSTLNYSVGK